MDRLPSLQGSVKRFYEIFQINPEHYDYDAAFKLVVRTYKPNGYQSPTRAIGLNLEDRFRELTGFRIKDYSAAHLGFSDLPLFNRPDQEHNL